MVMETPIVMVLHETIHNHRFGDMIIKNPKVMDPEESTNI